jgi:hypothetical protein
MNPFDGTSAAPLLPSLLTIPVIKQRMQVHGSTYSSIFNCAGSVFRNEGVRAFYVSYPTTLCMTVPFTAIQFTAYESISKVMNPPRTYDPLTHCVAGGVAGGVAAGLTTPLDVIKTLLQTRGATEDIAIRTAKGLFQAARIIKQRSGWTGFFRGWRPRVITATPSTAICWYVSLPHHSIPFFLFHFLWPLMRRSRTPLASLPASLDRGSERRR